MKTIAGLRPIRILAREPGYRVGSVKDIIRVYPDPPERQYDSVAGWVTIGASKTGVSGLISDERGHAIKVDVTAETLGNGFLATTHDIAFAAYDKDDDEIVVSVYRKCTAEVAELGLGDPPLLALGEARTWPIIWRIGEIDETLTYKPVPKIPVIVKSEDGTEVDITEGVQTMYDVVVNSLDFGSGFISEEDAIPILALAEAMGFERDHPHMKHYVEGFEKERQRREAGPDEWRNLGAADRRGLNQLRKQLGEPTMDTEIDMGGKA